MPTHPAPDMPPTDTAGRGRRSRAFTLIEVIVTLVIIAALLAVAMVGYTSVIGHSRDRATAIQLTQLYKDAAGTAAMRQEPVTLADFQNAATEIPVQAAGRATNLAAGRWQVLDSTTPITGMGQVQVTTTTTDADQVVTGLAALSRPGHCILVRGELLATVTTSVDGSCTETASGAATTLSASTGKLTASAPAQMPAPTITAGNTNLAVTWAAALADGGARVTGYTLTLTPSTGASVVKTTAADVTTLNVAGLTNGTPYAVTVSATNIVGTSSPSPAATGTPATVPGAMSVPTVKAGDAQADVTWTAPASDGGSAVTAYVVTLTPTSGSVVTKLVTAPALTVKVTGLTNSMSYAVTVAARNTAGTGAASPGVTVKPVSPLADVTDDFHRADGYLTSAPSGQAWYDPYWMFRVSNNHAVAQSTYSDYPMPAWLDIKSVNQRVWVSGSSPAVTPILRASSTNSYIFFSRYGSTTYVKDMYNGSRVMRGSTTATWNNAKVVGTTVTLLYGETPVATFTTSVTYGTKAGMGADHVGQVVYSFRGVALP